MCNILFYFRNSITKPATGKNTKLLVEVPKDTNYFISGDVKTSTLIFLTSGGAKAHKLSCVRGGAKNAKIKELLLWQLMRTNNLNTSTKVFRSVIEH